MINNKRVVITGTGIISPIGNTLSEFRKNLLNGKSGIKERKIPFLGSIPAGACDYDPLKYQNRKELRRGTRAGSIAIYCAREALLDAGLDICRTDTSRLGVYLGITEHGMVETTDTFRKIAENDYDLQFLSHHLNSRIVSNNPAGEVSLNLKIKGPHYCVGGACAAGNLGVIQGYHMILLGDVDIAVAGGVSESIHSFIIFSAFKNQMALGSHKDPEKVSRPFDKNRNGIVISEGGTLFVLETLENAQKRGAEKIYGEIIGCAVCSDASDPVVPSAKGQAACMQLALERAGLKSADIDIINTHATSTPLGDIQEINAIKKVFPDLKTTFINNTKGCTGHTMGAAGAMELAGNLPSFSDGMVHPAINIDTLDPECAMENLIANKKAPKKHIRYILNNSFGMLGINASVVVKKIDSGEDAP